MLTIKFPGILNLNFFSLLSSLSLSLARTSATGQHHKFNLNKGKDSTYPFRCLQINILWRIAGLLANKISNFDTIDHRWK
jgi:hypothetical protein